MRMRVEFVQAVDERILSSDDVQRDQDRRAQNVLDFQRRAVPVDIGNLRNHLQIRKSAFEGANPHGRQIGAWGLPYILAVEFGWQKSEHPTSPRRSSQPAEPFIRPSLLAASQ